MYKIRLHMNIFYLRPDHDDKMYPDEVKTKIKKINLNVDTNNVIEKFHFFMDDYNEKMKYGLKYKFIDSSHYYIYKK